MQLRINIKQRKNKKMNRIEMSVNIDWKKNVQILFASSSSNKSKQNNEQIKEKNKQNVNKLILNNNK